jgi:pyruvate dehydrogenase E1 component
MRLSTRGLPQPDRTLEAGTALHDNILKGAYWHVPPSAATTKVIAFAGVVAPEAMAARDELGETAALLQVPSCRRSGGMAAWRMPPFLCRLSNMPPF